MLLLLGGLFPLLFTEVDLGSLFDAPVLLSIVIIEWSTLRLVRLVGRGEPRLIQVTFWVFVYVWFGLAALAQTVEQRFPIAAQSFSEATQVRALLTILLGLAAYELGIFARASRGASKLALWLGRRQVIPRRVLAIAALGAMGTVFALWNYGLGVLFSSRYTAAEAVYGRPAPGLRLDQIGNKAVGLLQATLIWAPAFLALYLLLTLRHTSAGRSGYFRVVSPAAARMLLVALVLANFLVNNPISSPRYRFGGVALALIAAIWPLFRPVRLRVWACGLLATLLFTLPILDVFRYDERVINLAPLKEQLLTSADFAMFQQELNAQLYVADHGFTLGDQALGVVLGYVPRALWPGKPVDTGNVIVRTDAINASASLWATAFVDGGLLAVAVIFLAYGWLTKICEDLYRRKWRDSSFIAAAVPLFAAFQIIILRGDLQPAVGQLAPLLIMLLLASAQRSATPRLQATHSIEMAGAT